MEGTAGGALAAPGWFSAWVASVHAQGGVATRAPGGLLTNELGFDAKGSLAGRYPVPNGDSDYTYELAPLSVRLHDDLDNAVADFWLAFQSSLTSGLQQGGINPSDPLSYVEPSMGLVNDIGTSALASAAPSLLSRVPWWVWLAAGVVGYGALVNVGVVPPLGKLFHGKA